MEATGHRLSGCTAAQFEPHYQIPNLPIGVYSVSFKKTGFQVETHPQILVQAETVGDREGYPASRRCERQRRSHGDAVAQ